MGSENIVRAPSRVSTESEQMNAADLVALVDLADSYAQSAATHRRLSEQATTRREQARYEANKIRLARVAQNLRLAISEIQAARGSIPSTSLGAKGT